MHLLIRRDLLYRKCRHTKLDRWLLTSSKSSTLYSRSTSCKQPKLSLFILSYKSDIMHFEMSHHAGCAWTATDRYHFGTMFALWRFKASTIQKVSPNFAGPDVAYIFVSVIDFVTKQNFLQFLRGTHIFQSCCKKIPCLVIRCFRMLDVPYFLQPLKLLEQCLHLASSVLLAAQKWNQTLLGLSWVISSYSVSSNSRNWNYKERKRDFKNFCGLYWSCQRMSWTESKCFRILDVPCCFPYWNLLSQYLHLTIVSAWFIQKCSQTVLFFFW